MFRFSIRELMLVVVIAAVALAWWADRCQLAKDRDRLSRELLDSSIRLYIAEQDFYFATRFGPRP